jgi:hypothetical protein
MDHAPGIGTAVQITEPGKVELRGSSAHSLALVTRLKLVLSPAGHCMPLVGRST